MTSKNRTPGRATKKADKSKQIENKDAMEIMPEEMWEAVATRLPDKQDWLNLSRTCSSLQDAMAYEKHFLLLPEVLGHVSKYLTAKDLLEARLVCQRWKKTVDNLAEHLLVTKRLWNQNSIFKGKLFTKSSDFEKFFFATKSHPGNPFIGSTVRIIYWERSEAPAKVFWTRAKKLLDKYGQFILNITLESNCANHDTPFQTASQLSSYLNLVPNIKVLTISIIGNHPTHMDDLTSDNMINLTPSLTQLESLTLMRLPGEPQYTCDLARSAWKLSLHPEKMIHVFISTLPELLPTIFSKIEILDGSFDEVDFVEKLSHAKWPLKTLSSRTGTTLKFENIFPVIHSFSKTLTKLVLLNDMIIPEGVRIMLPHLTQLSFDVVSCRSLDFLLDLTSLEELTMSCFKFRSQGRATIKVAGIEDNMYKSNIWRNLPKLKILRFNGTYGLKASFQRKTYRREIYEKSGRKTVQIVI